MGIKGNLITVYIFLFFVIISSDILMKEDTHDSWKPSKTDHCWIKECSGKLRAVCPTNRKQTGKKIIRRRSTANNDDSAISRTKGSTNGERRAPV